MARYRFTVPAQRDVFAALANLIDVAGPSIALQYKERFTQAFRMIAANHGVGHRREDLTKRPYLFFTVHPYLIVYEDSAPVITIHAVVHGARDVKRLLRKRPV